MKLLVVFSNPPGHQTLRLDREDKVLSGLARGHADRVSVDRQHASQLDDIHQLLARGEYDAVHFSGHGSQDGILLEHASDPAQGELVSAHRIRSLIGLADRPPRLAVFLCCYSHDSIENLLDSAPFVVTAENAVTDDGCLVFAEGFYERLFDDYSIQASYEHAVRLLEARGIPSEGFKLSRRSLARRGDSIFVSSTPDPRRDSIEVNLDAVKDDLDAFGMGREELLHLLARKLTIRRWIFDGARSRALIPIGRVLFGEFSWENVGDVVYCKRLMKLSPDVPSEHWSAWSRLLTSYNDLAACDYRRASEPASEINVHMLHDAVDLFEDQIERQLEPVRPAIEKLGISAAIPHLEFVRTEWGVARDALLKGRLVRVVQSLERSLTNLHEVVDCLQPPEEARA